MKYENLILKSAALLLSIAALSGYQLAAKSGERIAEERRAEIARVEAHNAEVLAARGARPDSPWADGVYEGVGEGFGGEIALSLTVENGRIASVEVIRADGEDPAYFTEAGSLLGALVEGQSTEISAVSGATFSSRGILEAAEDALGKAVTARGNG